MTIKWSKEDGVVMGCNLPVQAFSRNNTYIDNIRQQIYGNSQLIKWIVAPEL